MMPSSTRSTSIDAEEIKLDLVREALRRCGRVQLRVWGMSMLPSLWPGDLVTVAVAADEELGIGDIVMVQSNQRCFLHRVVGSKPSERGVAYVTRGDAMPDQDPQTTHAKVLGRAVAVGRRNHSFAPARRISCTVAVAGWMLCRVRLLRSLALRFHAARQHGWTRLWPSAWRGWGEKKPAGTADRVSRPV